MAHRAEADGAPAARTQSIRAALAAALSRGELTARELSAEVGIAERDVAAHLDHLAQSLPHSGQKLLVTAPRCIACGFAFDARARRSRPSRCPKCKSERIDPARFALQGSTRSR